MPRAWPRVPGGGRKTFRRRKHGRWTAPQPRQASWQKRRIAPSPQSQHQELQNFTSPSVITGGGPLKSTYVMGIMLYTEGFSNFKMGYASAISWCEFTVILVITLVIFASSKLWVHYADE